MIYSALKTPGVYVNEVSIFPPSVAQVPTAIPAFVGYTQMHQLPNGESLQLKAMKVSSLVEYELYYGGGPQLVFDAATGNGVELDGNNQVVKANNKQSYYLYDSLQMFFANGGGDCYIVAVEKYRGDGTVQLGTVAPVAGMLGGVEVLQEVDEPTMIVFPDAVSLSGLNIYTLQQAALAQCADLMDRVGVFDILRADDKLALNAKVQEFRDNIGMTDLKYGAVYAPWLKVGITKDVHFRDIQNEIVKAGTTVAIDLTTLVKNLSAADTVMVKTLITALNDIVSDNQFINTSLGAYLKHLTANFNNWCPDGTSTVDLPSLSQGFDLLLQSVNNKIAAAEAEPLATQPAKVNDAAKEMVKMLRQTYNMVISLDDFAFKDPAFMHNQKMVDNDWTTIGFTSPFPPAPAAPVGVFAAKLLELKQWDGTFNDVATKAIASVPSATAWSQGVSALTFQTFTVPALAVNTALLSVAAPANDADRITNLKAAVPKLKDLFTYFYNLIVSEQTFGQALEESTENALIQTWPVYKSIIDAVNNNLTILPPSGAIAGIYARVDNERGVWKAPANVSVTLAKGTLVNITDHMQESLNVDVDAGKSVNAIRVFSGKGTMVWGARTLAGNDNEWRYVPVRRFFNMVEESVKKSTSWVVFEPNDANTWVKVKSMIENFLTLLWREGALAGAKPEEAFFVNVGLNQTMTFVDILEGRMIIRIGMAAVRPAEFIILEFSHKIQTS